MILHCSNFPSIGLASPALAPNCIISFMRGLYIDLFTLTKLKISLISLYAFFESLIVSRTDLYDSRKSYSGNVILSFG